MYPVIYCLMRMNYALSMEESLLMSPYFLGVDETIRNEIMFLGRIVLLRQGASVFHSNDDCERFFIVLKGSVRVSKYSETGHVITLYHITDGQGCQLTSACLLGGGQYTADAIAEMESCLFFMSKKQFLSMLTRSQAFRQLVFASINEGMDGFLNLIDQLAFGHMDHRLATLLFNVSTYSSTVKATHQELADELGTAREVVSRQLKEFEKHNWIVLHRGKLIVTDREALLNLDKRPAV
ncbi:Transcriptional regulator, Crp/Fnr family [hydrothermal vent metagenome]|uniref:Transcriptional regulator, Crp/Fnr family n=1 Tax=hydrothermal vent metagenome TaxID=652676 RepID=A0A3B0ZCY3_9ZZZZ